MANTSELLQKIYDASNHGRDIITSIFPEATDAEGKPRKFRLRTDDRTPSACLRKPASPTGCYHVVDYGGGEGERCFSPIDIYMRDKCYGQ